MRGSWFNRFQAQYIDTQIKGFFFLRASCYFSRGSQWGGSFDSTSSRLNFRAFDGLRLLSGNFSSCRAGIFFRYQIPCMNFFRPQHAYSLGLIGVHEFFSFNFPQRKYFFVLHPHPPPPISFLKVRPLGVHRIIQNDWNRWKIINRVKGSPQVCPPLLLTSYGGRQVA